MAFYTDEKGALVPYGGDVPEEAIAAIERADEDTIIERLTRVEAQAIFAYSYPIKTKEGTKDIIGIGVDGAKELARQLGNIKVNMDIKLEEKDSYFYVVVSVTDLLRNVTLLGVGRQSKYIIGEGMVPSERIDETAFVKAISKAQRNGILAVAPQEAIAKIVAQLDTKMIKKLPGPPVSTRQVAAPAVKAASKSPAPKTEEKPPTTAFAELGFSSELEQKQLRQQLFKTLTDIGKKTVEEKEDYLKSKSALPTASLPKTRLEELIKEVTEAKAIIDKAESLEENI